MFVGPPVEKLRQFGSEVQAWRQLWNVEVALEFEW